MAFSKFPLGNIPPLVPVYPSSSSPASSAPKSSATKAAASKSTATKATASKAKKDLTWGGRPDPTPELIVEDKPSFLSGNWRFGRK